MPSDERYGKAKAEADRRRAEILAEEKERNRKRAEKAQKERDR